MTKWPGTDRIEWFDSELRSWPHDKTIVWIEDHIDLVKETLFNVLFDDFDLKRLNNHEIESGQRLTRTVPKIVIKITHQPMLTHDNAVMVGFVDMLIEADVPFLEYNDDENPALYIETEKQRCYLDIVLSRKALYRSIATLSILEWHPEKPTLAIATPDDEILRLAISSAGLRNSIKVPYVI